MNDYDVGALMQEMELDLIRSMRRNLGRHDAWETEEGFKWEQWQAKKIREIRKYRAQNEAIMQSYSKKLDKATKSDLKTQFLEGGRKADKEVSRVVNKGYSLVRGTPSDDFFQGSNSKLDKLIKAINDDMNSAQNAALRQMDDVYRKTIFKAEAFLGSGATTIDKAVDMATKDFLEKGINCIKYADGKNVNIASYSRMAVRTANKRVFLMGEGERRKEWGISTVQVSQYVACSPLCQPWQGRIYIDDVYGGGKSEDGKYPLLSTAISGHLFHPNCRHTMSTFFEGINEEPELMSAGETTEAYEKAQREAEINRNIQKYKRLKEGSLDPQNVKKYGNKVKEWNDKYKLSRYKDNEGCFSTLDFRTKCNDIIKPFNIMKQMKKSQVGNDLLKYINDNNIPIQLLYGADNPNGLSGEYDPFENIISIYADRTGTLEETTLTVIHEATHSKINGIGGRKEEVMCFINEKMHQKGKLTYDDIKNIIKDVNTNIFYKDLKWKRK